MSDFVPADIGDEEEEESSSSESEEAEARPSKETLEKVARMKARVQSRVSQRMRYVRARKQRTAEVKAMIVGHGLKESDNPELMTLMHDYFDKERSDLRSMRVKTRATDFEVIKLIGKGGFGEVRMVRSKKRGTIHAMKSMVKKEMIEGKQTTHIKSERDLMVTHASPFLIRLDYAFTDKKYVYLVMEFCGGGDYMALLIKRDKLPESACAFYMCELALGIDAVHKLGYVHRDLKPDNMLITNEGHIKLTDFGLSKLVAKDANDEMLDEVARVADTLTAAPTKEEVERAVRKTDTHAKHHARELMMSTVGTPDYIAPEVLERKGYDFRVDWWSWGTILFESVFGFPPFYDKTPLHTCKRIIHFRQYFRIPRAGPDRRHPTVSAELVDVLSNSICIARRRILFDDIAKHNWFREALGVPFSQVSNTTPPFVPKLKSETDAAYFDESELKEPTHRIGDAVAAIDEDSSDEDSDEALSFFERQASDAFDGFTFKGGMPKVSTDDSSSGGVPPAEDSFDALMGKMRSAHEVAVQNALAEGRHSAAAEVVTRPKPVAASRKLKAKKKKGAVAAASSSRRLGGVVASASAAGKKAAASGRRAKTHADESEDLASAALRGDSLAKTSSAPAPGLAKKKKGTVAAVRTSGTRASALRGGGTAATRASGIKKSRRSKGSLTPEEFQRYFIKKYKRHYPEARDEEVVVAYKKYMASKVKPRGRG